MKPARREYRQLSPLGRLGVWAAVATILTLFVTSVAWLWPPPAPRPLTVATTGPTPGTREHPTVVTTSSTLSGGVNAISGTVQGNINTTIQTGTGDIFIGRQIPEKPRPPYDEPTASEMQDAVLTEVRRRVITGNIQSVMFLALMKLDVNLQMAQFDKVDCGSADPNPGYNCDYQYIVEGTLVNGDDNPETRNSIEQINQFARLIRSGPERGIERGRFVKAGERWVVVFGAG